MHKPGALHKPGASFLLGFAILSFIWLLFLVYVVASPISWQDVPMDVVTAQWFLHILQVYLWYLVQLKVKLTIIAHSFNIKQWLWLAL